jgi:PilZ domain
MTAKPSERSTTRVEVSRGALSPGNTHLERRHRVRTSVHWPVLLFRSHNTEAVESSTLDLSVGGFYCLSPTAFVTGESILGLLTMPTHDPGGREAKGHLECRVKVVRVDAVGTDGQFGIACQIEDYRFARP